MTAYAQETVIRRRARSEVLLRAQHIHHPRVLGHRSVLATSEQIADYERVVPCADLRRAIVEGSHD
jgi:hypothetical protein